MFIFLLQIRHMLDDNNEVYLCAVVSGLVWALWLLKVVLSRRYRPFTAEHHAGTSVIVPVVDEPLDLFREVLGRVTEQSPDEVIVVINGAPNPGLVGVCEEFAPLVQWVHTPIPGKRNAVKIGTEMSRHEITVLLDSDTIRTKGTLPELINPLADATIGGVTTPQRILEPTRSWITRWAGWLENSRSLYSMPAQSARAGAYAGGDPAPAPDPAPLPGAAPSPRLPEPRPALDDDLMAELAELAQLRSSRAQAGSLREALDKEQAARLKASRTAMSRRWACRSRSASTTLDAGAWREAGWDFRGLGRAAA
ncbi:glycosyltransferase [Cellulomonas chengniuliangii]|uniref:glycosyltransferase n=1 Tax=Cellulomonas chengniuliangii TaxID=2968084 RepID=UPI001D0E6110|nr:glycosyltransferase [Cellulomonas chengniuliangii]MCC2318832.1 glycosyltransferase [Cellulomonas chengniuliangii]